MVHRLLYSKMCYRRCIRCAARFPEEKTHPHGLCHPCWFGSVIESFANQYKEVDERRDEFFEQYLVDQMSYPSPVAKIPVYCEHCGSRLFLGHAFRMPEEFPAVRYDSEDEPTPELGASPARPPSPSPEEIEEALEPYPDTDELFEALFDRGALEEKDRDIWTTIFEKSSSPDFEEIDPEVLIRLEEMEREREGKVDLAEIFEESDIETPKRKRRIVEDEDEEIERMERLLKQKKKRKYFKY